jgi:hypothetical protein
VALQNKDELILPTIKNENALRISQLWNVPDQNNGILNKNARQRNCKNI